MARYSLGIILFWLFATACFSEELIIEPERGRYAIIELMNHAHTSIQLAMYGLTDPQLINALIANKKLGKNVSVLLETHPYKNEYENVYAIKHLRRAGVTLFKPSPRFKFLHEKILLLDDQTAVIMTFNFTRSAFKNQRNFALVTHDSSMINEIQTVLTHDKAGQTQPTTCPDLVWSPDNSRQKILALIAQAHTTITIYAENITDEQITLALIHALNKGVKITLLTSRYPQSQPNPKLALLIRAGAQVHYNQAILIHAKVIIIDQHLALVGSVNLTQPSLDKNRELSLITHDSRIIQALNEVFTRDWQKQQTGVRIPYATQRTLLKHLKYTLHHVLTQQRLMQQRAKRIHHCRRTG